MASKLFIVVGCLDDEDNIEKVIKSIESGILRWIEPFALEEQDEIVQTLNGIPSMKSIPNRSAEYGTVVSRYRGRVLDTTLLINPTRENLQSELLDLFLNSIQKCLIVFGGFVREHTADWILQDGLFSYNNFKEIFADSKVVSSLSDHNAKVTFSCRKLGLWNTAETPCPDSNTTITVMDSQSPLVRTPDQNGGGDYLGGSRTKDQNNIQEFTSFLEDGIGNEVCGIFNTLEPPHQEGFLKIRKPCLYIFPAGNGDSSFFSVNGFNMLVNGGACSKPWFWKLIQHVDRVDSVLATHLGSDNLPGLNSLLLRKLQERQVKLPMDNTTPEYQELRRCLISPDLGPLFINAPMKFLETVTKASSSADSGKSIDGSPSSNAKSTGNPMLKTVDVVKETLRLTKALDMELIPLMRKSGTNEPITLFSKIGLGKLEMYVLHPGEGSKEITYVNEKWGCGGKSGNDTDSSICALLVWHPSNPNEKIVRVLFPGNANQSKIFEGLESIKNLPFMKVQHATKNSISRVKQVSKANGTNASQKSSKLLTTGPKKPTSATLKKSPAASMPAKKETATTTKASDKKLKAEKPTKTKVAAKSAPPAKASAPPAKAPLSKDRASAKAGTSKTDTEKSKKSALTRPTSAGAPKRNVTTGATKAPKVKQTATSTKNVTEKPKKPATTASTKMKLETAKGLSKKSPKPLSKKLPIAAKTSTEKDKSSKKAKAQPAVVTTPAEDLTPEFLKLSSEKEQASDSKPVEPLSIGSDEPASILSDRHSPEGEDGSTVQYAESLTVVAQNEKDKKQDLRDHDTEQNDNGFVIMNRPEISEDSDMISTNGSSANIQQETPVEDALMPPRKVEDEFLSSDKSTPSHEEQPQREKMIKFDDDTNNTDAVHKPVERLPTPFHSLQDSSATTETSPMSENENPTEEAKTEKVGGYDFEDLATTPDLDDTEVAEKAAAIVDQVLPKEPIDIQSKDVRGDDEVPRQEGIATGDHDTEVQNADNLAVDPVKDVGSEVHSSFNSSVEGSYELYPTGRSPLASAQETIAETISDFKHDEPPPDTDLEDPSACLDTQPQQMDPFEDPTMSAEAPDLRYSMSTTSTGSQFARMEPPFSTSDTGTANVKELVADTQQEPDIYKDDDRQQMPEVDQIHCIGIETEQFDTEYEQAILAEPGLNQAENMEEKYDDDIDKYGNVQVTDDKQYEAEEESDINKQGFESVVPDKPMHVWEQESEEEGSVSEKVDIGNEKNEFDLHAQEQNIDTQKNDFDEYGIMDDVPAVEIEDVDGNKLIDFAQQGEEVVVTGTEEHQDEQGQEIHEFDANAAPMTGSLASSAQDQGPDDDSEAISLTETADTSEADPVQEDNVYAEATIDKDDDGPTVEDYKPMESEIPTKSDLVLPTTQLDFPLHGGAETTADLVDFGVKFESDKEKPVIASGDDPFTAFGETSADDDIWKQQYDETPQAAPRRHQPLYVEPSAPLADTEEFTASDDQLKAQDLDSPLDVNAKPFIPKCSMPMDESPTCGAEAHFGQGDNFDESGSYSAAAPTSPPSSNNPFLMDLMASSQNNPFNQEEPAMPPSRSPDPCAAQDKVPKVGAKKPGQGSVTGRKAATGPSSIYVDLTYVPNHGNKSSVGVEFFKKIRAKYYVISGNDLSNDEPSAEVWDHLLEGRKAWFNESSGSSSDQEDTSVTVIPTVDTHTLREWYKKNFKELESCNIHMVASGSKVMVQDESIDTCKIEF